MAVAVQNNAPQLAGAHHTWPFNRQGNQFVVRVVEPLHYAPQTHAELFNAVISELFDPQSQPLDSFTGIRPPETVWFDLVTFPEAFVPAQALIDAMRQLATLQSFGCIHVGLRPTSEGSHLFSTEQVKALLADLIKIETCVHGDLKQFSDWVGEQTTPQYFNLGCLFTVDADGFLRVCLHPKVVRSHFEVSPLEEDHMYEASLLNLVTLLPVNKHYKTVTLQPLICSDALNIKTDRGTPSPMVALNTHANSFANSLPDHIDIVSLATCTPQMATTTPKGQTYRGWHEDFRDVFKAVAKDSNYARQNLSVIVFANFQEIGSRPAGVSGVFVPLPPDPQIHENTSLTVSCFGKVQDDAFNIWSCPDDDISKWKNRGFIAGLKPVSSGTETGVRIFGFTIHRLLRDTSLWSKRQSLAQCNVRVRRSSEVAAIFTYEGGKK